MGKTCLPVVGQQHRLALVRLFNNETIDKKTVNKDDEPSGNPRCLNKENRKRFIDGFFKA
ncbi:MAG TPA: hypothetical protein GXX67_01580 [Petrimonas sp.]|jgi:hypothetical protein|nr:hypothetical protein [Petrimonas sp.]